MFQNFSIKQLSPKRILDFVKLMKMLILSQKLLLLKAKLKDFDIKLMVIKIKSTV